MNVLLRRARVDRRGLLRPLLLAPGSTGCSGAGNGPTMASTLRTYLLAPSMLVVCVTISLFFLQSTKDVLSASSFEGYVEKFIHANPPTKAPETPFFDANGVRHTLSEYRGKVVLVNFWATWCPACIMEMPTLDRLQAKLGGDKFIVLAISQDMGGVAAIRRFLTLHKLEHLPVLLDERRRLGLAFGQDMLPTTVLLDTENREVGRLIGPADWTSPAAVALISRYMRREK